MQPSPACGKPRGMPGPLLPSSGSPAPRHVPGAGPVLKRLVPHVADFHGASNRLLAAVPLGMGSALSFGAWGLELLGMYLTVRGAGAAVPFLVIVFIFAVASIAGSPSLLPGGILGLAVMRYLGPRPMVLP